MHDFGITPKDYTLYISKGNVDAVDNLENSRIPYVVLWLVLVPIAGLTTLVVTGNLGVAFLVAIFGSIPLWGVMIVIMWLILVPRKLKRSRLLRSPVASRIKLYEEALAAYQVSKEEAQRRQREAEEARREAEWRRQEAVRQQKRKLEKYWIDMDGVEFEQELGNLFRTRGYGVEGTPTSGDQGVDLVLRRNGVTTVVQCKAHKNGVGPAVARELYGSMVAFRAKAAILACTGGFTRGVHKFVEGKPIRLLDASAIAKIAEGEMIDDIPQQTRSQPKCPYCSRQMVLRKGRNGEFWGCSAFPSCRGTRGI